MDIYKSDIDYDIKADAYSLDPTNYREILEDLDKNCPVLFTDKEKKEQEEEKEIDAFWESEMQNREDYYNEFGWGSLEEKRHNIASTLPHFDSKDDAINFVQDEFVQTLIDIKDEMPTSQMKKKYEEAIEELQKVHEPKPCFADEYPREALWANKDDYTYTMPLLVTRLTCDYLARLDWRLIIIYAPYLIKRFGFSSWYYSFRIDKNIPVEAKKNIHKLRLDKRGKKILLQLIDYADLFKSAKLGYAPVGIHLKGFYDWLCINEECAEESVKKADKLMLTDEQKKVLLDSDSCFRDGDYIVAEFKDGSSETYEENEL